MEEKTGPILIRGARQLLTLRGPKGPRRGTDLRELAIIPDGGLLIRNGVLEEVGPSRRVENLSAARGALEINATGRVVMPGFVDSHTHLICPPPGRGTVADSEGQSAMSIRTSSARLLEMRLRPYLEAMARHGTTTVEAATGSGPDESAEIKALRVLASLDHTPVDVVPTFLLRIPKTASDVEVERIVRELPPRIYHRQVAQFAGIWWDGDPSRERPYARYLAEASKAGLPSRVHAEGPGCAAAMALAIGHQAVSVDHLEHISAEQSGLMARARTIATLLPATALEGDGAVAPARALIDGGAAVAIASNFNPRLMPVLNLQFVVALACRWMAMTPAEAIAAATINGAHVTRRAATVGSLEPGKCADLLVLNLNDYREMATQPGTNLVHLTIKGGQLIYREGAVMPLAER